MKSLEQMKAVLENKVNELEKQKERSFALSQSKFYPQYPQEQIFNKNDKNKYFTMDKRLLENIFSDRQNPNISDAFDFPQSTTFKSPKNFQFTSKLFDKPNMDSQFDSQFDNKLMTKLKSPQTQFNTQLQPFEQFQLFENLMRLLKLQKIDQIFASVNGIVKQNEKLQKFTNSIIEMVKSCYPEGYFKAIPSLQFIWKWLKKIIVEYVNFQKNVFTEGKGNQQFSSTEAQLKKQIEINKKLQLFANLHLIDDQDKLEKYLDLKLKQRESLGQLASQNSTRIKCL